MNQLIQQATQRLRSQGRASRNNARRAVSSLAALSLLLMAQGGLTPPRVHAAPAAYLNDQAPEVAPAHQKRMNSLWERSAKGETIGSRCGFFGGLIENPFGARPLSPQAEAEARTAQELCYVQGFSRSIHFFLAAKPDQCAQLTRRMAIQHGLALMGITNPQKLKELKQALDANIGDLVRQHCQSQAKQILDQ